MLIGKLRLSIGVLLLLALASCAKPETLPERIARVCSEHYDTEQEVTNCRVKESVRVLEEYQDAKEKTIQREIG